jgi:hypothetical protein
MENDVQSTGPVVKRERTVSKSQAWSKVIGIAGNLGWMIATPAVLFAVGGAYLDKWLGTSPLFVLIGIPLALIVSAMSVWKLIKQVQNEERKGT